MNYYYYPMTRQMPYIPNWDMDKEEASMYSPKEGFEKGNMFGSLYTEYKNFQPQKLVPKTEQEKMLMELQTIRFAAHELNLYLDTHPEDQSMIYLFQDYIKQQEEIMKNYEEKYGPLTPGGSDQGTIPFAWVSTKWPWEVRNV